MKRYIFAFHFIPFFLILSLILPFFSGFCYADTSSADAIYEEGFRYFQGDGIPQDIPKGVSLILQAANSGSVQAMLTTAYLYNLGLGSIISDDFVEGSGPDIALSWFEKVADSGAVDLAGTEIVGTAFDYFLGSDDGTIQEDDAVALKYFQKAAEYGNPTAINMMASFYIFGFGVEQDAAEALNLFSQLASQGDKEALYSIEDFAYAFYSGTKDGIGINFSNSFQYYLKLTEFDNVRAMYNVGLLYQYGLGVSQNHDKALEWLTKAFESGFEPAKTMIDQLNENN